MYDKAAGERADYITCQRENVLIDLHDIPCRIFLDACVVSLILDHGEEILKGIAPPKDTGQSVMADIAALYNIFFVGHRAMWQLAISPHTYGEIVGTRARNQLESFGELWQYWREIVHETYGQPSFAEAEDARVAVLASGVLGALPDMVDRVLLCDAVVYRCELFCTREGSTILRHRSELEGLPLEIVTPTEWWARIQPYAELWT